MRYAVTVIFLVSGLVVASFFAGFKLGLFLFPQETQIDADNKQINADNNGVPLPDGQVNPRNGLRESVLEPKSAPEKNFCSEEIKFLSEEDKKFCLKEPKINEARSLEIDLTANRALLYSQGKLVEILPLSYQSPENRWYEAPTGYFRAGIKDEKHLSSLFPVIMPYAVEFYEDFFVHGIPYYRSGADVSSQFTGGCLRFANNWAKEIYDFIETGDPIVVYKTFADLEIKPEFHPPVDPVRNGISNGVDLENFFIERRFLNPYRQFQLFGGTEALEEDYYQHTGVDFAPNPNPKNLSVYPHTITQMGAEGANINQSAFGVGVYAIDDAKVVKIQLNDGHDHGFGNAVILEHQVSSTSPELIYSLYGHLASIKTELKEGDIIKKGEIIGEVGNSGFGCENYWRIGPDGCASQALPDIHLHFEIKKAPVLENPEAGKICEDEINGPKRFCYGYVPDYPQEYGYLNPIEFLFKGLSTNFGSH